MVFINNRDEYLPFLKAPGVRMQTPLVNNVTTTTTTLNRDVAAQVQQQQQQQLGNINNNNATTNNNINANTLINNNNSITCGTLNVSNNINNNNSLNNNGQPQVARALLICRPNSHPFNNRTLYLEPGAQAKVGRSVARIRVSENNAIFDCKVLSRNHAVLWYKDGRFFIKDTGSSNGTFINNIRLSQTCTESEPHEISSGDIVQFGVDVMENTRRETHGCITATLKLFLPDGRETKASQKVGIGGQSAIIPPVDLYRLNQYIQEANQREQILETKLISLQKMVESTKQNSFLGWQAMIDEDRLLSRIDMLEKKLQYCQKNITEDKLREELLKLVDEKEEYQNAAKEAMYKLHQERHEAVHKQISLEKALCTSEDECSLLREQLTKTKQQLQEMTVCMDTLKSQYDEKVASSEEQLKAKESEITSLTHKLDHFVDVYAIGSSDDEQQQQQQQQIHSSAMSNWLKNSDIKKLEGSEDIIKAICNDTQESEITGSDYTEGLTKLQRRINTLEKNFTLLFGGDLKSENESGDSNDLENDTTDPIELTGTTNATTIPAGDAQPDDDAPAGDASTLVRGAENGPAATLLPVECDGNQNDVNSASPTSNRNGAGDGEDAGVGATTQSEQGGAVPEGQETVVGGGATTVPVTAAAPPYGGQAADQINQNVLKRNIRLIKNDCMTLLRQVERTIAQKQSEQIIQKAKYDELETELLAFKAELESRPKQDELDQKQQLCDSLAENLSTLRSEVDELRTLNDRCQLEMERMEIELLKQKNIENEKISAMAAAAAAAAAATAAAASATQPSAEETVSVVVKEEQELLQTSATEPTEKSSSKPESESTAKDAVKEEQSHHQQTQETLMMMPTTLLVVTDNAPVAEMPSPVLIPTVPMVDVETQTDAPPEVPVVVVPSMPVPDLPLAAAAPSDATDTSGDGGDASICSNLDDLDDDDEDDDEKTETIEATALYNAPVLDMVIDPIAAAPRDVSVTDKPCEGSRNGGSALLMAYPADDATGDGKEEQLGTSAIDYELAMINHPDVQREEELIAFKEKYSHLSEEHVRLKQQLQQLSQDLSQSRHWLALQIAACIVPVLAIVCYFLIGRS
ncbi:sarcolemmal membrane-associated protein isoform X1 [Anopheles gambiae]|uniref:sarcolemmal membrane-associated protein isoform X1 n=1 Tax=Anopheles gambiae TaxID=7165 RepID=UPI002AC8E797|nr:sarcolemmal membrane-associated protein isoform X1 [Anopheles gambiae]XP_061518940.1 sarcolemmal membrane-associated protein isoform X1 [Anopheles gambiae]XP_061518941.1 sarcolemmal membrane-associated protein isoform X1 [Anopheles gambiae]